MTTTTTDDGLRVEIRLPDMIVTSEYVDEATQPWGGLPCYRYRVSVSARAAIVGKGQWSEYAYGSNHDYQNGDNGNAEELAWLVLSDLLDAYFDPAEFWENATAGDEGVSIDRARGIIELIDYAEMIGAALEANEEAIREAQDR